MDLTSNEPNKKTSKFNIYHFDAQLALAFQLDCENLLIEFKQQNDFSFNAFTKVWKDAKFTAVFKGHENILMLQAYLDNCFFIAKKFLFLNDLHMQTGGIYILYGLYYKQPIKQWVKIRLTQTDVEKINLILEIHKLGNLLDPVFIFNKMRLDGAFQYCALPQPLGLESRFMRRVDLSNEEINVKKSKHSVLDKFRNLMEEDPDLVQFEETDEEYQKLAQKYKEKHGNLYVFPSKIGEELKKAYSEVFRVNLEDESEVQDPLYELKNKAMSNTNAVYRGEKKVLTGLDLGLGVASTSKLL